MKCNQEYLVRLLASAILQTEAPEPNDDIDWDFLLDKCAEQNITGLAASAILRLPEERKPYNFTIWFGSYIETLQMMTLHSAEFDRMLALFHANGIDPICVKGSVSRNLYPDEKLRTMGDYDIWVKPDEQPKLEKLFTEQGYSITERPLLKEAEKGEIRFEIFTSLKQEFENDTERWSALLWNNTCRENNGFQVLNPTFELFYTVTHAAKHYVRKGCGIRSLLDIVLILKHRSAQIDFGAVKDYCETVGIDRILFYFLSAAKLYFETDTPITKEIPQTDLFVEYMLEYGVYGLDNKENPFVQEIQPAHRMISTRTCMTPKSYTTLRTLKSGIFSFRKMPTEPSTITAP